MGQLIFFNRNSHILMIMVMRQFIDWLMVGVGTSRQSLPWRPRLLQWRRWMRVRQSTQETNCDPPFEPLRPGCLLMQPTPSRTLREWASTARTGTTSSTYSTDRVYVFVPLVSQPSDKETALSEQVRCAPRDSAVRHTDTCSCATHSWYTPDPCAWQTGRNSRSTRTSPRSS